MSLVNCGGKLSSCGCRFHGTLKATEVPPNPCSTHDFSRICLEICGSRRTKSMACRVTYAAAKNATIPATSASGFLDTLLPLFALPGLERDGINGTEEGGRDG